MNQALDTTCKNVQVKTFNASGIWSYYNLPCVNDCRYEELKHDDKNFPWNEIEEELGECWDPQEGSKRYILLSDMNATARIWLILVASNIKPSKYLTKISRKTVLLLYLLMTKQPVKLEAIIYKSMCKVAYNGRAGCALIFPHMISDFYFNAGVPEDDTDAKIKPKHQLDYKRVGEGRVDPDDPCTSEAQAHPTAEASAQPIGSVMRDLLLLNICSSMDIPVRQEIDKVVEHGVPSLLSLLSSQMETGELLHYPSVNSSDMFMSNSKCEEKSKEKGKQERETEQESDSGSIENEVLPVVYSHVSLTSEICGSNHVRLAIIICYRNRIFKRENRSILNNSAKIIVQLNDISHISSRGNTQVFSSVSGSHYRINSLKDRLETNGIE
ncbi:hypothetical protein G2W53_039760 [Senna tora]|uniref:Uncharacterized protein n=1 Tax=Senna tora TaxID=362788 RepID=A0A834T1S2_9FABA|nr:hypothetical protein G2W53_039760 [Senna tora]